MTDYELSKKVLKKDITEILEKYKISKDDIILYGNHVAKIKRNDNFSKDGKLILVTSINPTPYGEGKTTLSIGINDAFCRLGKNSIVVLREPSLGPVFGSKGGATGGGMSQIVPMEDINLHFTGDLHAITSANNLLSAIIDNHLFQGNDLQIDENTIYFERCMDINDRSLRTINLLDRKEHFNITPASEIMAILCLSKNMGELKQNLKNILIGYNKEGKSIYVEDLHCEDSLALLLKDAIYPNAVQTMENNLALVHGGPFANIAHGCSTIASIQLGLALADYVITEAGFGSDMGGIKFFDITCRKGGFYPDVVIINTTIRALKHNGKNKDLETGIENLYFHIENMKRFSNNLLVVLNYFDGDTEEEIAYVRKECIEKGITFEVSMCYKEGGKGGEKIVEQIEKLLRRPKIKQELYSLKTPLIDKINILCKQCYHANRVVFSNDSLEKIKQIEKSENIDLPICIAKTQYSITDDPKLLGYPHQFDMTVTDIKLNRGAGFITVYMGNIITMPGLGKNSNYKNIRYENDKIEGLL